MGRPRKPETQKLSRLLSIPVTRAMDREVRRVARALGCDIASLGRKALEQFLENRTTHAAAKEAA